MTDKLYYYAFLVEKVIDGDTFHGTWDLGHNITCKDTIRLSRINAPELNTTPGLLAKQFIMSRIDGKSVVVKTERDSNGIDKQGGFGRYLAEVFYYNGRDWINLNDELLATGLAELYHRKS